MRLDDVGRIGAPCAALRATVSPGAPPDYRGQSLSQQEVGVKEKGGSALFRFANRLAYRIFYP